MKLTTTSSFQLNTEKHFYKTISRSQLQSWQRKLLFATTLNSKKSDMTKTTYIYFVTFLRNTAVQMWFECLKALLPVNYSSNFLCLRKNSGEENSGAMDSTLPQYPSGEIGNRSNDMLPTKERRWRHLINLNYSSSGLRSYPVGLPRGNWLPETMILSFDFEFLLRAEFEISPKDNSRGKWKSKSPKLLFPFSESIWN